MSKKVFVKTFGCQMNEYHSGKMADVRNAAQGDKPTDNVDEVDLILLTTGSVSEKAQGKVFSDLDRVKHLKRRGVLMGAGGCVASQEGAAIIERISESRLGTVQRILVEGQSQRDAGELMDSLRGELLAHGCAVTA